MTQVIQVLYTCVCGINDRKVSIPVRGKDEDIKSWMDNLTILVSTDHINKSPHCLATSLKALKIPTNNREYIGGPEVLNDSNDKSKPRV